MLMTNIFDLVIFHTIGDHNRNNTYITRNTKYVKLSTAVLCREDSRSVELLPHLVRHQPRVCTLLHAPCEELMVAALLRDHATLQDHNLCGAHDGREAMRDEQHRALLGPDEPIERPLDGRLALRIEGGGGLV